MLQSWPVTDVVSSPVAQRANSLRVPGVTPSRSCARKRLTAHWRSVIRELSRIAPP
jgi:hypothetical protein